MVLENFILPLIVALFFYALARRKLLNLLDLKVRFMSDFLSVLFFVGLCLFLINLDLEKEVEVKVCTHEGVLSYVGRTGDHIPSAVEGKLGECETKKMPNREYHSALRIWRRGTR